MQGKEHPTHSLADAAAVFQKVAKQTGTSPQDVMGVAAKMANNNLQQAYAPQPQPPGQNSPQGMNAQTPVSQVARGAMPMAANKVAAQSSALQSSGTAPSQAQNIAATNPQNGVGFKDGGVVKPQQKPVVNPPSPGEIDATAKNTKVNKRDVDFLASKLADEPVMQSNQSVKDQMAKIKSAKGADLNVEPDGYAKGGRVEDSVKHMSLEQVMKLLATHPDVAGKDAGLGDTPDSEQDMRTGGIIARGKGEQAAKSMGSARMMQNDDAGTYKKGGSVKGYAGGGDVNDLESDQITGYGPDGVPVIQNPDGSDGYGDINSLLDRPRSAGTLGTGAEPKNSDTANTANLQNMQTQGQQPNQMAKGGEETGNPPPGSLSEEVADDIPAKLSQGEFVFSADSTRFWGLQKLEAMQDFARKELSRMSSSGTIRSPGDGKNPGQQGIMGQFMQDQQPDQDAYGSDQGQDQQQGMACGGTMIADEGKKKGGLIGMSNGGSAFEEEFKKGGPVTASHQLVQGGVQAMGGAYAQGGIVKQALQQDHHGSTHQALVPNPTARGGAPLHAQAHSSMGQAPAKQLGNPKGYDKGGIVSSTASNLNPKKLATDIPAFGSKATPTVKGPHVNVMKSGVGNFTKPPKMKKGGLLRDINETVPSIGA